MNQHKEKSSEEQKRLQIRIEEDLYAGRSPADGVAWGMFFELRHCGAGCHGGRTAKLRRCLLLVAAFAVLLCACSRPDPGIVELQSSREAVRAAKSWRSAATGQFPAGQWVIVNLISVDCPGRFDRVALFPR